MSKSGIVHIGIELIQQGWMQGSFLHNTSAPKVYTVQALLEREEVAHIKSGMSLPSNQWTMKEVVLDENDLLVIVSQACDIQKRQIKNHMWRRYVPIGQAIETRFIRQKEILFITFP